MNSFLPVLLFRLFVKISHAFRNDEVHGAGNQFHGKIIRVDCLTVNVDNADLTAPVAEYGGKSLGEVLITPTKIYVKPMLALFDEVTVKAVSHITGGGFYENIPRSLPKGYSAKIEKASIRVLPIFDLIAKTGNIPERDMFNTYNMGVGMSVVVPASEVDTALEILRANGEDAYVIGSIVKGEEKIDLA